MLLALRQRTSLQSYILDRHYEIQPHLVRLPFGVSIKLEVIELVRFVHTQTVRKMELDSLLTQNYNESLKDAQILAP